MFRKNFLVIALAAILICLISVSFILQNKSSKTYTKGIFVMDTYCDIKLDKNEPENIADILYKLENNLNHFDEKSEITSLNNNLSIDKNTETGNIISHCLELQKKYKGKVDITAGSLISLWNITGDNPHVPNEKEIKNALLHIGTEHIHINDDKITLDYGTAIDLGAVAKGYALDKAKEYLDGTNVSYGIVSMTSSILLYGEKPDGELFKIAVRGAESDSVLGYISTESGFVSSSGAYERYFTDENGNTYSHILDPQTGYPVKTDLEAVTVICKNGLESDYLSTLIYMGGTANIENHLHTDEYKIVAADRSGKLYISDDLDFKEEKK